MDIARVIREARARTGLTQAEFADRAGTSQPTLSAYERGRRRPTLAVLRRIAEVGRGELVVSLSRVKAPGSVIPPDRGVELQRVLELASQFPARHHPTLDYPRFGRP